MEETPLVIKPHHCLDIIRDFGAGREHTPHPYGHAVHLAAERLRQDPRTLLRLTVGADFICAPCNLLKAGRCTDSTDTPGRAVRKGAYNRLIDRRLFRRFGLSEGCTLRADEFCRLALERLGDIREIYREEKSEKTAWREENLFRGLRSFLENCP
ncbi:hypothetical protein LLH00_01070 [bacterium]|nr:hypothetical protein [bacterium]